MGLDSVEILMELQDEFSIHISDAEAERCRTPGDIVDVCCTILAATGKSWPKGSSGVDHEAVIRTVQRTISRTLGVPLERVTLDADLAKTLGVD